MGVLLQPVAKAQSAFYDFSRKTETYTELTGATVISVNIVSTPANFSIPAGFKMYGKEMPTTLKVGGTGYVICTGPSNSFAFDPCLHGLIARSPNSVILGKIETTGSDTIVKIEWRDLGVDGNPVTDSVNFQVWLYKKSKVIEFHYGPSYQTPLKDTFIINTSLLSTDFNTSFESHTIVGVPSNPVDDTDPYTTKEMAGFIPTGTVYVFTPKSTSVSTPGKMQDISVYPNPATDYVTVKTTGNGKYTVYDVFGRVFMSGNLAPETKLDLSMLTPGLYLLKAGEQIIKITKE
jgi:hypothetical protein